MMSGGAAIRSSRTVGSEFAERLLFGGALTCRIPARFRDVSDVRQVPDHQECWQGRAIADDGSEGDGDEGGEADSVLVFEILERQPVDADHAAAYFFADLAESNGCDRVHCSFTAEAPISLFAPESPLLHPPHQHSMRRLPTGLPKDAILAGGSGTQRVPVAKIREQPGTPSAHSSDSGATAVVVVVSIQLMAIRLPRQATDLLVTLSTPTLGSTDRDDLGTGTDGNHHHHQRHSELLWQILSTLQILDWSLFG